MGVEWTRVAISTDTHARLKGLADRAGKSMGTLIDEWASQADEDGKLQSLRGWRKLDDSLAEILAEQRRARSSEQEFLLGMERLLGTASTNLEKATDKIPNRIEALVSIVRSFELETLKKQQEILAQFDELQINALELVIRQRVGQSMVKNPELQQKLEEALERSGLQIPDEV